MIKECFKNRDFRVLWGAGGMTGIARAMEFLALSLYALQELGLPYLVTIIFAARMLPMSLLGIIIGTISERISPLLLIKIIYCLSCCIWCRYSSEFIICCGMIFCNYVMV